MAIGILVMRGGDVDQFVRFLGIREHDPSAQENVQTYVQRTMLAYIGWQVFLDHPVAGAGWQSSAKEEQVYGDYLDDARREFPDTPAEAFPSPEHPYGIQNAYVQALADLGVIGFLLLIATFAAGLWLAVKGGVARAARGSPARRARRRLAAARDGHVDRGRARGGVPLDALTWIALGLAAAAAGWSEAWPRLTRRRAPSTGSPPRAESRTTCAPRSRRGCRQRLRAPMPTSAVTGCWTSVPESSRTCRTSSRMPTSYVGVDIGNPAADLEGSVEALPVEDGSFDLVLCTQVLEHVEDPAQAVRELHRVTSPGGRVLASTHGVQVYHPSPADYWRWTHAGLERLFAQSADWASVSVTPVGGAATCLAAMSAVYADLLFRKVHLTPLSRASVWTLNSLGGFVDRAVPSLRAPIPGSLFLNYHVVADKPR